VLRTSGEIGKKQNDVQRTSNKIDKKRSLTLKSRERRQDLQYSKNIYVLAMHFSRNHFILRQTKALIHKALLLALRISYAPPF
jgi:hypothetical protein